MWYLLFKRLFQLTLFFIWILTLIYLICLSAFTFVIFNICLIIFLFWFILTLIGWSITLIPILKFVYVPWYHRQCRLWTQNNQQKRYSVAFFHPYCKNGGSSERVLWIAIESILKKYKNDIQIIIYTGDIDITTEKILQCVKERFGIDMEFYESSITFIYLRSRFLIEANYFKILTSLGQNIGSIILGFEAFIRFIPDIYIDSMGYALTYPCFYYLASIPIISYVHYSTINSNIFEQINEEYKAYNNQQSIIKNSLLNKIKLVSYQIYTYVYGWCGRCSKIVYCNSSWTKKHIESIWRSYCIHLVYPPCDIKQFLEMSLINNDEQIIKTIVSIGQFRREKNHELQIRAFHQLLQKKSDYRQKLKLTLIGNIRHNEDRKYLEQLQLLVDNLNISNNVIFKLDINFQELKIQFNQAIIGLHTMQNEHFGLGIVEMMAAGVIVVAHKSGGPHMDIIDEGKTGFFASDIDSYATMMETILEMKSDERRQIQEQARNSVDRFSTLNFERLFMESLDKILFYFNMASKVIGKCEKNFIIRCLRDRQRLDHRLPFVTRDIKIEFREEYGSVVVSLGLTKVLAQTSCKIVKPKETRPNEGRLRLQLKNSHAMVFNFETGRQTQWTTLMSRHLLQNIRDSGCVDMESLCILAHENVRISISNIFYNHMLVFYLKVWEISVNLHVLDYDGNILDCANLAALCALAHFRYPAVTVIGTDVHVHPINERNPQPIRILHYPIMISFALFENGEYMLIDACEAEEKVMEGLFAIGMNQHKELSTLAMFGEICLSRDQIENCISLAHHLVRDITKEMRSVLEKNREEQLEKVQAINRR
ncbi:unnamed protein product [Rotaria sp. Silwood2]|nr:unnamed protein product [Rotaria sp. Silwood2]CAF4262081.1 unnamed protein product [Rotaria sp. Silwood2]